MMDISLVLSSRYSTLLRCQFNILLPFQRPYNVDLMSLSRASLEGTQEIVVVNTVFSCSLSWSLSWSLSLELVTYQVGRLPWFDPCGGAW